MKYENCARKLIPFFFNLSMLYINKQNMRPILLLPEICARKGVNAFIRYCGKIKSQQCCGVPAVFHCVSYLGNRQTKNLKYCH